MKRLICSLTVAVLFAFNLIAIRASEAFAHCQVPCGIYDDAARISSLREDATTIEKAVRSIEELAGKNDARSANQLTRWVNTKESHASHVIEVVSEYFLAQKLKPVSAGQKDYEAYLQKAADHHSVIVAAMKSKQNADQTSVKALREAIEKLALHYAQ